MAIAIKTFDEFRALNLSVDDNNLILKNDSFTTAQGLRLNSYDLFKNSNDNKVKNFTSNILTEKKEINQFLRFKSLETLYDYPIDLNSKLAFSGLSPASANNFLTIERNNSSLDSNVLFLTDSDVNNTFIVDFLSDEKVTIRVEDGGFLKTLSLPSLDNLDQILKFRTIDTDTLASFKYQFNYTFDESGYLQLFSEIGGNFTIISPASSFLSAVPVNNLGSTNAPQRGIIKLSQSPNIIDTNNLSNYVLYDYKNNNTISNDSLTGSKFNFLANHAFEVTNLSTFGSGNIPVYTNKLDFFNLKNQISNSNNVNSFLPLDEKTLQRDYTTILNVANKEEENENLIFGYNFYTKEYKFLPDKNTKFTLPDNLFPYQKVNINDTNLVTNGAFGAKSPYFSDKVFKLQDNNKNVNSDVADFNQLFLLEDGKKLEFETIQGILLKEEFGKLTENDNSGVFLCSWLSGNGDNSLWFDRYYFPRKNALTSAISGVTEQVFKYTTQAQKYFNKFGITDLFYDIESNLTFQPNSTYFYSRIGNNYINKIIDLSNNKLKNDTLTLNFSGSTLINQNKLNFSDFAYDSYNLNNLSDTFNISFDLNQDSLSAINSYQILGNSYNDGFTLKTNFYFTPFVILHKDNKVIFYDKDFNKIRENTYSQLSGINDVLYLEQNNNLVLVGTDKLIKTSIDGEILDIKETDEIGTLYHSRTIQGYNEVIILNNTQFLTGGDNYHVLQLNNLSLSSGEAPNLSASNSIITTENGKQFGLQGYKGKNLDNTVGVSISGTPNAGNVGSFIMFENLSGNGTFFSNPLSTSKVIYDLNVYNNEIYIQSFENDTGSVSIFNKERELQRTLYLNTSAVSGYKLDFINDNNNIKLLSFSQLSGGDIIVDKFDLKTEFLSSLSSTFELGESFNPITIGGISKFQSPTNFNFLETKYKNNQDKLNFKINVENFIAPNFISVQWEDAGAPDFSSFTFGNPADGLSAWDGKFDNSTLLTQESNFELILPITNLKQENSISINFNLINGNIDFYLNGTKKGEISFITNKFPIESLKFPNLFLNTQNIKNTPINKIINTNDFYGKGGNIQNFKIYDLNLSEDFINYLYLKNLKVDNLNFDIPCGSRNNIEEVNNFYSYNIPGRKNNNFKLYIKNGGFDLETRDKIKSFLDLKLKKVLPANVENIVYDFSLNRGREIL